MDKEDNYWGVWAGFLLAVLLSSEYQLITALLRFFNRRDNGGYTEITEDTQRARRKPLLTLRLLC